MVVSRCAAGRASGPILDKQAELQRASTTGRQSVVADESSAELERLKLDLDTTGTLGGGGSGGGVTDEITSMDVDVCIEKMGVGWFTWLVVVI